MTKISFQLKIQFPNDATEPERFFRTAASLIESYNELDNVILAAVSSVSSSKLVLEDIRKGSLIATFMRTIEGSHDGSVSSDAAAQYVSQTRTNVTKTIAKNARKPQSELMTEVENEIANSAKQVGLKVRPLEGAAKMELADTINRLSSSSSELRPNEIARITTTANGNVDSEELDVPRDVRKIDIKKLEADMTHEEIENTIRVKLLIKRPDYLGKAQWAFKKGEENISASISDEAWLNNFHSRAVALLPGDALDVKLKEVTAYDIAGNQISVHREIVKVLKIIGNMKQ